MTVPDVPDVNAQLFFGAILDAGGNHIMKPKDGDTILHIIVGPQDVQIIPSKDAYEEFPADSVVNWLLKIGLPHLIIKLTPKHPMAKSVRKYKFKPHN